MATKKRVRKEKVPKSFWVVTITSFTDDYKPRGDDWSESYTPMIFLKLVNAEKYLLQQLVYHFEHGDASDEDVEKYCEKNKDTDYYELKEEYKTNLDKMEEVMRKVCRGEFVQRTLDWNIDEISFSDDLYEKEEARKQQKVAS